MSALERIEAREQLDELLGESRLRPVWIFKHSLICSVSDVALAEFRRFVEGDGGDLEAARFAVVEIQRARPVSAAVAEATGVAHESPQVLLLRGGRAVWHASHWSIRADALRRAQNGVASEEQAAQAG